MALNYTTTQRATVVCRRKGSVTGSQYDFKANEIIVFADNFGNIVWVWCMSGKKGLSVPEESVLLLLLLPHKL